MKDNDTVAGEVMATVMSLTDEHGDSIAERMSVADLWLVIQHAVMTIRRDTTPADLSPMEAMVWGNTAVRVALYNGQKIVAIKEARNLTSMSLKEAKDLVERNDRSRTGRQEVIHTCLSCGQKNSGAREVHGYPSLRPLQDPDVRNADAGC
jgi:ribosomal protein L7/L12